MKGIVTKVLIFAAATAMVIADQLTKQWAVNTLRGNPEGDLTAIPGLLEFTYLENSAAAMGLFAGMICLVIILGLVVAAGIVFAIFRYENHSWASNIASALILAGGVGNLIDRMVNVGPNGERFVVDFIHVMFFPYIFNVADCCVTVGAVFLGIHVIMCAWKERKLAGQKS